MTGRSQAVRLPKEYRVTGDSVYEFPRDFALERRQD